VLIGLDATSALRIISGLKRLGQSGRTVIISLHSPRSEIWDLVDNILLLSRGSVIFTGKAQDVLPYFKSQGYIPDPFTNPMEFLIDLVSLGSRTPELERCSRQRVENLKNVWKSRGNRGKNQSEMATRNATATRSMPTPTRSSPVPFSQQTYVLTARTFRTTIRDPMGVCASFIRAIGTAILNGWIFYNLDESLAGIRSRQGSLYVASNINGYIILICEVFRLSVEMKVFDRERKDGSIGVTAFLLSQRTSRLFLEDLPMTLIYSAIFYFMVGFDPNARQFFIFFAFSFMTHYAAVAFAAVCIGIARNFGIASLISSGSFFFQSFTCGFLIQTDQIPVYVRWLKWISYMFYVFSGLCTNEFAGHFYACPYSTDPMDPACQQFTGHAILDNLGFPPDWTGRPIAILVAFVACFYIVAGLLLHYNQSALGFTWKRRTSKKTNPEGFSTTPLSNNAYAMQRNQQVVISLDNYALNIKKWAWPSLAPQTVQILRPLTTEFQPGQLNVIIGPSGSGKTSLLSLMARSKAHTSPTTQYQQSGTMLYNRAIPSPSTIRSATSFVRQENDSLIPTLTVRETLQFSAQLRLPSWLSLQEKLHRSEHVLLQMSLMDCANNTIKRISGGEKRRLTIAVQLLTNPSILLLDEPTSGLDVFTAQSIIHHLHQLSNNGMTIIMSIHQARASMLNQFSHVVLLASGGYQVYAGEGKDMVTHFRSWGYNCPETTNPADFVLDLISNDQASETAHFISHRQLESQNLRRETSHITQQITAPAQLGNLQREVSSFRVAFPVVLSRSFLTITRQPWVILVRGLQVVGIAAAVTLFYAPLQHNYEAVQSRMGFVQEFAALYFVGIS
jgi:ABC-type multidrug transport system ATPase subunit